MDIEKVEREDFQKLNELLAENILKGEESTKAKLHALAEAAEEIHKNYKTLDEDAWNNLKKALYDSVSIMLTDTSLDELKRAAIKVQVDKYVDMLNYGRTKTSEPEKQVEEKRATVNAENFNITINDVMKFINSSKNCINFDVMYDELSEDERKSLEEEFNEYKKSVSPYSIEDETLKNYLMLKLSTKNWLKTMNQDELYNYERSRNIYYDEFSASNFKDQRRIDNENMRDYDFEVSYDMDSGRNRGPAYYDGKFDMRHEARLCKKFNQSMEEIYAIIDEKNKSIGTR